MHLSQLERVSLASAKELAASRGLSIDNAEDCRVVNDGAMIAYRTRAMSVKPDQSR